MFNFLKSLFTDESESYNESELINYATIVLMGTGQYAASSMTDDWPLWSKKMQEDLLMFERFANKYSSVKLFVLAGKGWGNYSIWFVRKSGDKTTPLKKAILMFNEALKLDPNNIEAKTELSRLLIERVQIRNLEQALKILETVPNHSNEIQVLINKAKRWLGNIEFNEDFDYTKIQLIPLNFLREERTKCRTLIRTLTQQDKVEDLKKVLDHMYRIAVIHDAATFVMLECGYVINPRLYASSYRKLQTLTKHIRKYSYTKNGKINLSNNCFFSDQDYKSFEKIFGPTQKDLNPSSLIKRK